MDGEGDSWGRRPAMVQRHLGKGQRARAGARVPRTTLRRPGAVAHMGCILQDPGVAGHRGPRRAQAEVVAAYGPLRPHQPCQCPGRWQISQAAQLRWGLLHPGRRPPPRLPGGRPGVVVEQQPVPPGDPQRGPCPESCFSCLQPRGGRVPLGGVSCALYLPEPLVSRQPCGRFGGGGMVSFEFDFKAREQMEGMC